MVGGGLKKVAGLAAALLSLTPAAAVASVSLGQLAATPGTGNCSPTIDRVQATVTGGTGYVVPGGGTITSWSTNAGHGTGQQLTFKIFRPVEPGNEYKAVAHDTRDLTESQLNEFTTSIPVKAGDVLGLNQPEGVTETFCDFIVGGEESYPFFYGNLADGQKAAFSGTQDLERLNVSAVLTPSNAVDLGVVKKNTHKGTAKLNATVPGPGELTAEGKHVKVSVTGDLVAKEITGPGKVKLSVKASGKGVKQLNHTGKLGVDLQVTYTPGGGTEKTETKHFSLKKSG
jgi:hypothetical protein